MTAIAAQKIETQANPAGTIATFAAGFTLSQVPDPVVRLAKRCLLDALGIGLASAGSEFARRTANALSEIGGMGRFPVLGMDLTLSQRDAAHLNGTLIHGLDFDDTHSEAVVHASASAAPTMLSAGLAAGASGERALAAFILAAEIACRAGVAASGGFHRKGFHPTAVCGAIGSAVGAAYLYRLDDRAMMDTQGLVLSQAAGSLQFLDDGAWTKRNHPGWASVCGQTAAAMAKHGFFGPRRPYDGRFGLYALYASPDTVIDSARLAGKLGTDWEITGIAFKPYPACHMTHAYADAILALVAEENLNPATVAEIVLHIHPGEIPVIGEPQAQKQRPQNSYDAQFSCAYVAATALAKGRFTLAELEDAALADRTVLDLCAKTRCEPDPTLPYPKYFPGRVTVHTADGRTLERTESVNRGAADLPLSDAEIEAKFMDNAQRSLSRDQAERLGSLIGDIEKQDDLSALAKALQKS